MSIEKVKQLIPAMEFFIKASEIDGAERGFTFRTNDYTEIEEFCKTGNKCQMIMKASI